VFHQLDAKLQLFDFFALGYPAIFGASLGGAVVSSGSAEFGAGDSVVASTPTYFWRDNRYGTFQRCALVRASNAIKVTGEGYNVLDAVTIPTQAGIAALALGQVAGLERPIPGVAKKEGTIVVWGAGSTVGTYAVQYASQADYTVIATANLSSPAEEERVKSLGVSHVINYRLPAQETVDALKGYGPFTAILDAAAQPSSLGPLSTLLLATQPDASKRVIHSMGPDGQNVTDDSVTVRYTSFAKLGFGAKSDGTREEGGASDKWLKGLWGHGGWLRRGVNEKSVVAQKADVTEGVLEKVQECLDKVIKAKGSQVVLKLV